MLQVGAFSQQPADDDMRLARGIAGIVQGIGALDPARLAVAALQRHFDTLWQALEVLQGKVLEHSLVLVGRYVTEGHEDGVAGMIVTLVESL